MSHSQKLIAICPECKHERIYNGTALRPRITCKECKTRFYIETPKTQETPSTPPVRELSVSPHSSIPPQNTPQEEHDIIEDPNELLMSVSVRELNKSDPEVRWANVLLQLLDKTKQLEAKSKSEVQSKLKQYSITELIELRKKLIES